MGPDLEHFDQPGVAQSPRAERCRADQTPQDEELFSTGHGEEVRKGKKMKDRKILDSYS